MNPIRLHDSARINNSIDTVIIGGSVAGLQTALLLAQGGANVELFDSNDVMHVQPRTLIATAQLADALGFFPSQAVVNEVHSIEICSAGQSVKVTLPKADLVIERAAIISMLARKASAAGVKIHSGHKFLGFAPSPHGSGVTVQIQDKARKRVEEFSTRCLIGADGGFSQVATAAAMNGLPRVPLLQARVELPSGFDPRNVSVWFEPEQTPYFFWLIPESEKTAALGFIADESKTAKRKLLRFLNARGFKSVPSPIQAAWIPLSASAHRPWRQISGCDVYLVGDAAGHVKVTTVGGLVTGLWGARAAAESILKNTSYAKALRRLNRELWLHELIRRALNRFRPGDYDQLLHAIDASTARLLGRHSRDELTALVLKLAFTQPRLLSFLPRLFASAKLATPLAQTEPAH
jgi:digeranylgeranylglycerophospholipid reductase